MLFSGCGSADTGISAKDGDGKTVSFGMTKDEVDSVLGEGTKAAESDSLFHYGTGSGWDVYFRNEKVIGFGLKQDGKQITLPDRCYMKGLSADARMILIGETTKADLERILGNNRTKQDSADFYAQKEIVYVYSWTDNGYVLIDSKEEGRITEDSRDIIVRFIFGADDGILRTVVVTDLFCSLTGR